MKSLIDLIINTIIFYMHVSHWQKYLAFFCSLHCVAPLEL